MFQHPRNLEHVALRTDRVAEEAEEGGQTGVEWKDTLLAIIESEQLDNRPCSNYAKLRSNIGRCWASGCHSGSVLLRVSSLRLVIWAFEGTRFHGLVKRWDDFASLPVLSGLILWRCLCSILQIMGP